MGIMDETADAPEPTVSSPFANARTDAREHTAQERLEAAAATERPSTASVATQTGSGDPARRMDDASNGRHASEDTDAAVRDGLDDAGTARPMPADAMEVHTRDDVDPSSSPLVSGGIDRRWIIAGEVLVALIVVAVVVAVATLAVNR